MFRCGMVGFISVPDRVHVRSLRVRPTPKGSTGSTDPETKEVTRMGKVADAKAKRKERKAAREQRHEARERSGSA